MSVSISLWAPPLVDIRSVSMSSDLEVDILKGLISNPKRLPSILLWDDKGLEKFERVRLANSIDYYPSRKETEVIKGRADDIAETIPAKGTLVELGSGNTGKTALILSALHRQGKSITYYALDLSPVALLSNLDRLIQDFPTSTGIGCHGLLGTYDDFLVWFAQKPKQLVSPVTFLWLGNSIGNLNARDAAAFLAKFVSSKARGPLRFIIGVDGCQDLSRIKKCYDPADPVTRDFLMNGLDRANEVLGRSVFCQPDWTCEGFYDATDHIWRDYYVARKNLVLAFAGSRVEVAKDERIFAISSAKWTHCDVERISWEAGLRVTKVWKDNDEDSTYGNVPPCYWIRHGHR